jgi:putative two-component system response regulator
MSIECARIVQEIPTSTTSAPCSAEHERWDGGGYPDGLAGQAIPLASRITSSATPTTQ